MSPEWLRQYFEDENTEALREELSGLADNLSSSELTVLLFVAQRLTMGQKQYGVLNPFDGRDWDKEAREEAADLLVYLAASWMKREMYVGSQPGS